MNFLKPALVLLTMPSLASAVIFQSELWPKNVVPKNGAPSPAGISNASAVADFELVPNEGNPFLKYEIRFTNLNLLTDVTGIHFHVGYTPPASILGPVPKHTQPGQENGPHLLNVFGLPREDDADLFVSPDGTWLRGQWGNEDRNFGPDGEYDPGDSVAFGNAYSELFEGDIYIQVHTFDFNLPNTGELRGQIVQIPEPSAILGLLAGLMGGVMVRRR